MTVSKQSQDGAQFHSECLSGKFHTPSYLEHCSVVIGTLKSDACHMYHLQIAVSFWACIRVGSKIWAVNHILARRHIFTYCMLCSKHNVRASDLRAWARNARTSFAQLSLLESAMVGPKVTSRISILSLNGKINVVAGCGSDNQNPQKNYQCRMYSTELLMMGREVARNM
jgi:hypothetical protein